MDTNQSAKFQRNTHFDAQFDQKVPDLRWYPYVGNRFGENGARIIVFAHNIPVFAAEYSEWIRNWADKATWADAGNIYDYTYNYDNGANHYTKAFKSFIKGAVGLETRYTADSEPSVIQRIDSFVTSIAYSNFIQDAVIKTKSQMVRATPQQEELSIRINRDLLRILDVTHCICWGTRTYEYVRLSMQAHAVVSENHDLGKTGFSSRTFDLGQGRLMQCLRVFHPSMPGFGCYSKATHTIISRFLGTPSTSLPPHPA